MRKPALLILGSLFSMVSLAAEIPLTNWAVPPYTRSSGGITTMTDVTSPRVFVGVAPCRLVDTRAATIPNFPAGYGPPALTAGAQRNFDLNSDPQCAARTTIFSQ